MTSSPTSSGPVAAMALGGVVAAGQDTVPSADAVLRKLQAGNENHVAKHYQHPHQTAERQRELSSGQHPDAIVLSCADSRVAPEIILDQGLGDLFDVRVAGNVAGDAELASIEYAAEHLHAPVLVVMGHQKCGAVTAAADVGEPPGHLPSLVAMIRPAVEKARGMSGDLIDNAVRINVENVVRQVRMSKPVLGPLVDRGGVGRERDPPGELGGVAQLGERGDLGDPLRPARLVDQDRGRAELARDTGHDLGPAQVVELQVGLHADRGEPEPQRAIGGEIEPGRGAEPAGGSTVRANVPSIPSRSGVTVNEERTLPSARR